MFHKNYFLSLLAIFFLINTPLINTSQKTSYQRSLSSEEQNKAQFLLLCGIVEKSINHIVMAIIYGANLNLPCTYNNKELYPLSVAMRDENTHIFNYLIGLGANTNIIINNYQETLLMAAVFEKKIDYVEIILKNANVNVNHISAKGHSAIMFTRNPYIIKLLVKRGANPKDAGKALPKEKKH